MNNDDLSDLDLAATVRSLDLATRELWEERSAIIEYDGGVPRAQAERLALKLVLGQAGSSTRVRPTKRNKLEVR